MSGTQRILRRSPFFPGLAQVGDMDERGTRPRGCPEGGVGESQLVLTLNDCMNLFILLPLVHARFLNMLTWLGWFSDCHTMNWC